MDHYTLTVATGLGPLRLRYTRRGLSAIDLGQRGPAAAEVSPPAFMTRLAAALQRYAEGERVQFVVPLDVPGGTSFQRRVWEQLGRIPHGQTRSYAWLAARLGQPPAVRAVGGACGANPVPIVVPCHRVLRADGSLGGFRAGLPWKRRLLAVEQIAAH